MGADFLKHKLEMQYCFYWNFINEGIHTIKIIFNKKLSSCYSLFSHCSNIIEIDCSHFDCSNVLSCICMFNGCRSLKKINFGKLDFSLVTNFGDMFHCCENLIDCDISNFNTKNCKSFNGIFSLCKKLKKINLTRLDLTHCETLSNMFSDCQSITEIDMINANMSNLKDIGFRMFFGCINLKKIKMRTNFSIDCLNNSKNMNIRVFYNIPENGTFISKKGETCDMILNQLPPGWIKYEE